MTHFLFQLMAEDGMAGELRQRIPRLREPKYLAWLRNKPCVICRCPPPNDPAHVSFADMTIGKEHRGKGMKAHDKWALPLCRYHHREQSTWLCGEMAWWYGYQGKDPLALCETYHRNYREETGEPEAEVQRYRIKRKRDKTPKKPPRKIQNRSQPWPTRKFHKLKKRATI